MFRLGSTMYALLEQHKTEGIFTEHCVVIVEGKMVAGVFEVSSAFERYP